jgi:hypothetical protein
MLDSGVFTIWKRSEGDLERIKLRKIVRDALAKHGNSRKKVADITGIPYGRVLDLARDTVEQQITLENYAEFALQYKHLFKAGAFNFDVISPGNDTGKESYENWEKLRSLGVTTIPVHHLGDDETYLKKYLDKTDYIGIGAVAKLTTNERLRGLDYVFKEYLMNKQGDPTYRTHGLGLTSADIMLRYPWYSVDSSMSASVAVFGSILLPTFTPNGYVYDRFTPITVSNQSIHKTSGFNGVAASRHRGVWHMRTTPGKGSDSFFVLPPRARDRVIEYCNSLGYEIDTSIEGQVLNPVMASRKKQRPTTANWLYEFEDDELPEKVNGVDLNSSMNVSDSWVPRAMLNFYVASEFIKHHRKAGVGLRWYHVTVSSVFDIFVRAAREDFINRTLISYAYLRNTKTENSFFRRLRETIDGNQQS